MLTQTPAQTGLHPTAFVLGVILFGVICYVLARVWTCLMHCMADHKMHRQAAEKAMPHWRIVVGTLVATALLFLLSLKTIAGIAPFDGPHGAWTAGTVFACLGIAGVLIRLHWPIRSRNYAFGVIIGTAATFILIGFKRSLLSGIDDPYVMALGIVCTILMWRFLFGPWKAQTKAVVLGTFVFWIAVHMYFREAPSARQAHVLAAGVAMIPAAVWCWLFLEYHKQRWSHVFLMFFAGMLSTAPILFYDRIVRSGAEMHFFLFRIVPESFSRSSSAFVSSNILGFTGVQTTVMATLISFLIVGLIEETSKFWVLKKSGQRFFSSIDDVMQLGIIVAIGFAFAENVLNPSYFLSFVRQYLLTPDTPQWSAFLGNVMGRSILTNMVHILSTGVLGYFFGMALFARPYMKDAEQSGRNIFIPRVLHEALRLPQKEVFRIEMITIGIVLSLVLHGCFNFIVTLPDILPGRPRTIGDLLGSPEGSFFHGIAILILPSLFYVVGGFWLLSLLFSRKEAMKERGHLVRTDTFVQEEVLT